MADTKVSGLTGAASMLTTHEFPVNEAGTSKKVTGAQILAKTAQGALGYAQVTANQGAITTVVDLTSLTVTITAAQSNGRRIRITGCVLFQSTTATDDANLGINEGATVLTQAQVYMGSANVNQTCIAQVIIQPSNATHTYKLTATRVGAGTVTMAAAANIPAFILIEDIGV